MRAWLCLSLASSLGCSYVVGGEVGYAHAFAQAPERSAAVANGYAAFGAGDDHFGLGFGGSVRIKASDAIGQFSIAPIVYLVAGEALYGKGPRVAFFSWAGVDLVTAENVANQGSVSIGSPFVEAGCYVRLFGDWGLAPGLAFEDDVRFNGIPNTGYMMFTLGIFSVGYEGPHNPFAKRDR